MGCWFTFLYYLLLLTLYVLQLLFYQVYIQKSGCVCSATSPTPRLQRGVGGQLFVTINLSFFSATLKKLQAKKEMLSQRRRDAKEEMGNLGIVNSNSVFG